VVKYKRILSSGSKPALPYESASWRRSRDGITKSRPLTLLRTAFLF